MKMAATVESETSGRLQKTGHEFESRKLNFNNSKSMNCLFQDVDSTIKHVGVEE